jgi:hypothetical protein
MSGNARKRERVEATSGTTLTKRTPLVILGERDQERSECHGLSNDIIVDLGGKPDKGLPKLGSVYSNLEQIRGLAKHLKESKTKESTRYSKADATCKQLKQQVSVLSCQKLTLQLLNLESELQNAKAEIETLKEKPKPVTAIPTLLVSVLT